MRREIITGRRAGRRGREERWREKGGKGQEL